MYREEDLTSAIDAGILTPSAVQAFRLHVARSRELPAVDEENVRLVTSFNDVFVVIACSLLLGAIYWIGASAARPVHGWMAMAAMAWLLAEFFTRRRRMALPSMALLLAFAGGVHASAHAVTSNLSAATGISVLAVAAHWFRFKVPLSVAVGVAGAATLGVTGVGALLRLAGLEAYPVSQLILVAGILVFLLAMYWDKSDPRRVTGRADVAFWLHILAAPMMIHPVVTLFKLLELGSGTREALTVVALYAGISVVSLAIDRRALMVSALVYVLVALNVLLEKAGVVDLAFAATAFVLGSALLLLSIYWHAVRSFVLRCLPPKLRASLPPLQ